MRYAVKLCHFRFISLVKATKCRYYRNRAPGLNLRWGIKWHWWLQERGHADPSKLKSIFSTPSQRAGGTQVSAADEQPRDSSGRESRPKRLMRSKFHGIWKFTRGFDVHSPLRLKRKLIKSKKPIIIICNLRINDFRKFVQHRFVPFKRGGKRL
jgi:hypothetical protein